MVRDPARPSRLVLVVDLDEPIVTELARLTGWQVHAVSLSAGADLLALYRTTDPDAVVMPDSVFATRGPAMLEIRRRPILCAGRDDWPTACGALDAGAVDWIVLPVSPAHLAARVEAACRAFQRVETLAAEKQLLAQTLETRKLVDRAKAVFMRRLNLDEPTAHKRLQQESQNRRIAIGELARRIIESDEMLGERPMVEN
jgi:AmiR/NasT family two-component response regulator